MLELHIKRQRDKRTGRCWSFTSRDRGTNGQVDAGASHQETEGQTDRSMLELHIKRQRDKRTGRCWSFTPRDRGTNGQVDAGASHQETEGQTDRSMLELHTKRQRDKRTGRCWSSTSYKLPGNVSLRPKAFLLKLYVCD